MCLVTWATIHRLLGYFRLHSSTVRQDGSKLTTCRSYVEIVQYERSANDEFNNSAFKKRKRKRKGEKERSELVLKTLNFDKIFASQYSSTGGWNDWMDNNKAFKWFNSNFLWWFVEISRHWSRQQNMESVTKSTSMESSTCLKERRWNERAHSFQSLGTLKFLAPVDSTL